MVKSALLKQLIYRTVLNNNDEDPARFGLALLHDIEPVIQQGPQCGLVALKACSSILEVPCATVNEIFETAKRLAFTKNGEIFSCEWLAHLAESVMPCSSTILQLTGFSPVRVLNEIFQSHPVLIPYDCDKNHQPCKNNGRTAHWALVIGFLILSPDDSICTSLDCSNDSEMNNLNWINKTNDQAILNESLFTDKISIYVMAMHGKSKHPGLWLLDDLLASNGQLNEFSPDRTVSNVEYVLPSEGVKALKNKIVVLMKNYNVND